MTETTTSPTTRFKPGVVCVAKTPEKKDSMGAKNAYEKYEKWSGYQNIIGYNVFTGGCHITHCAVDDAGNVAVAMEFADAYIADVWIPSRQITGDVPPWPPGDVKYNNWLLVVNDRSAVLRFVS